MERAEEAEKRRNSQPAREIRLALPAELTDEQRAELVFNYSRDIFVDAGMIADISIHRPDRHGDERNHHAHIYLTMRELDEEVFSDRKNREWNKKETLEYWREQWEEYANAALEDAGSSERIDHRSYEDQGINREATRHLGKDASAIEREGRKSRIGSENRAIEDRNRLFDGLVKYYSEIEIEIERELQNEFIYDQEQRDPFTTAITQAYLAEEAEPAQMEAHAKEQRDQHNTTPFTTAITRAYLQEPAQYSEPEQERRWYETIYSKSLEIYSTSIDKINQYWQSFVNRSDAQSDAQRFDRERDEQERDR